MRVALNGWFLNAPVTGTGQYILNLTRAFAQLGPTEEFSATLFAPQSISPAPLPVSVARPFSHRLGENLSKVEFEHITFPRVSARGFDLAHIPHFGPPLYPPIPTVVTIHDLIPMLLPAYRGSRAVRLYTRLAAAGARRAAMIIADSHATRGDIQRLLGIRGERVRVVYLAAEGRFRPVTDAEIWRVRAKYSLPEKIVLYLGGFDARKNVCGLIEAWASLQEEHAASWKLVLGGQPPPAKSAFFPDPRALAEKLRVTSFVQFTGHVDEADKPALYSAARVFLYPSLYEGFGLPPLEAMACGTPVICSNSSSLPEVVGDAAILLEPDDVSAWSVALRGLIHHESQWSELRARGLVQSRKFSWSRTARETLDAYRAALVFCK